MPTYQYACTSDSCGHRFERVQAFTDDAITTCPECAARVRKVYGSVGVVFKGSGFYRNDSRDAKTSGSSGAPATADSSATSSDGSSNKSASSDSTTAAAAPKPKSDGSGSTKSDAKSGAAVAS
jgi:putative FmdB family regulatory protein